LRWAAAHGQPDPAGAGHHRLLSDRRYAHLLLPRFLTGLASGVIIVLGESWITGGAAGKNRAP
jgi:hypothetical protein